MHRAEWHVFIHMFADHKDASAADSLTDGPLILNSQQLASPFPDTFEEMCQRVDSLPGAYCEPDGSIGWNPPGCEDEHMGGTLHCLDDRIMCVELFSSLGEENWTRLLDVIDVNCAGIVIQMAEEGVFLSRTGFRHWAYAAF